MRISLAPLLFLGFAAVPARSEPFSIDTIGNFKQTAIYIEASGDKSKTSGTGFLLNYATAPAGVEYQFLVTASHVLASAGAKRLLLLTKYSNYDKDSPGSKSAAKILQSEVLLYDDAGRRLWSTAPDESDVAVVFVGIKGKRGPRNISSDVQGDIAIANVALESSNIQTDRIPTDRLPDIFYFGYPRGLYSADNLQPFARRCTIALDSVAGLPVEGIQPDEFLIDCPALPGDSGAPVYAHNVLVRENGVIFVDCRLIGVLLGQFEASQAFDLPDETIIKKYAYGFSRIAPAKFIISAIQEFLKLHPGAE
jgi:hypothetical protein